MTQVETAPLSQDENPVDLAEESLKNANPVLADVVDFVVGDYINLASKTFDVVKDAPHIFSDVGHAFCTGIAFLCKKFNGDDRGAAQELSKLSKYQSSCMKVGAVVAAAAFVGLRFVKFGKVAELATQKLGGALGRAAGKKVFTEVIADKLAKEAFEAVERALERNPNLTIEAINAIKCKTISKVMEDEVASTVSKDLLPVLKTLGKKGLLTKGNIVKALISAGVEKEEAQDVAKLLMKAGIHKHMANKSSLAKMEEILIKEITAGMKEEYQVQRGAFRSRFAERWGEYADKLAKDNKISKEMSSEMKRTALDGFDEAVEEGIERGVERGVREAFDAYRRWKFGVKLNIPSLGFRRFDTDLAEGTSRTEYQRIVAGWRFHNLEDQWKEAPVTRIMTVPHLPTLSVDLRSEEQRVRGSAPSTAGIQLRSSNALASSVQPKADPNLSGSKDPGIDERTVSVQQTA